MIDIIALEKERLEWSLETFPTATALSSLTKLREEIKEIEADILEGKRRPEEYADALKCLFDSAGRQGVFPEEIFLYFKHKLAINKSCKWIDNGDGTYSRIKPTISADINIPLDNQHEMAPFYVPPDHGDKCWEIGAETFTRKEVAHLLHTQRAMIANDLKSTCGNDLTDDMFSIINHPRNPEF